MLNIILFGPPGAGKGTQSEKLIQKYGLVHISTGDLLRSEKANKTELGLLAKKYIDEGHLVPDEVVIGMIRHKLEGNLSAPGYIFDGFPRTVVQARELDKLMVELGTSITIMVSLEVAEDELIKRLVKRGETSGRSDDNEETVRKRLEVYNRETSPVANHYNHQGKLSVVNGLGTIDEIFERICNVIADKIKYEVS
jgi:adenylate kinase